MKCNLLVTKWCVEMRGLISDTLIRLIQVFWFGDGNAFPCVSLFPRLVLKSLHTYRVSPPSSCFSFSFLFYWFFFPLLQIRCLYLFILSATHSPLCCL